MLSLIRNIGRKCIKTFEVLTGKALIIVLKSPQLKQNFFTNLLYIGIFIYMYICILYIYIYIYIYIFVYYIYIYIYIYICILYIYIYIYTHILWSSNRKLAWVGFEPTTTEFRSDALTDWAIRPWPQVALLGQLSIATPILSIVQCHISFRL